MCATAEGLNLDVLLGQIYGTQPSMPYPALITRAFQACEHCRSLDDAWLAAHERVDSEMMTRLQNEQEIQVLEMALGINDEQVQNARTVKEGLQRTMESAEIRYQYYSTREKVIAAEVEEGKKIEEASSEDKKAADNARAASEWALVPSIRALMDGGFKVDLDLHRQVELRLADISKQAYQFPLKPAV